MAFQVTEKPEFVITLENTWRYKDKTFNMNDWHLKIKRTLCNFARIASSIGELTKPIPLCLCLLCLVMKLIG